MTYSEAWIAIGAMEEKFKKAHTLDAPVLFTREEVHTYYEACTKLNAELGEMDDEN